MAKKIVGVIKPFDMKQDFYVYEDGNKLAATAIEMNKMSDVIFSFVDEYNISQVDLIGSKQYIKGLIKNLQVEEIKKYNTNKITFNII